PFEIKQDGEIIKHTVKDKKKPEKVVTPGTTTHPDNNLPAKEQVQSKIEKESTIGGLLPATGSNLSNWIFIVAGGLLLAVGSILFMKRKNA
ncbi:LPXTG cell wall anchor domain-containing protein, partial [Bacillus sp. Xin1]